MKMLRSISLYPSVLGICWLLSAWTGNCAAADTSTSTPPVTPLPVTTTTTTTPPNKQTPDNAAAKATDTKPESTKIAPIVPTKVTKLPPDQSITTTTEPTDNIEKLPLKVLHPRVRIIKSGDDKYTINLKYLKQHLDNIFIACQVENSGKKLPSVYGFVDRHIMGSAGIKVLVKDLLSSKYTDFMFVKKNRVFSHPISNEILGIEYSILGTGELLDIGKYSTVEITSAKYPIEKGHLLVPRNELTLPETINGKVKHGKQSGYILANIDGLWDMGAINSVVISLGAKDGLAMGDVLSVYRPEIENMLYSIDSKISDKKQMRRALLSARDKPLNKQGEIMIYKTFAKLSLAIVVNAHSSLTINDVVKAEP